jgi:uncharacterized protein (TIGR00255 family)
MKSMTGFGRASFALGKATVSIQVSSVNRKTLDLTVKLPDEWEALEPAILEKVRGSAVRGKVHTAIELSRGGGAEGPAWDEAGLSASLEKLAALAGAKGIAFTPTPELLWQIAQSSRRDSDVPGADEVRGPLLAALDEALAGFAAMRQKEGTALLSDFLARIAILEALLEVVAERAPMVVPSLRDNFLKRLREAGLELDLNDERVLKEIALFADRSDVTEEITRLRSHLEQLVTLLESAGEIGRKAEFILQEISREVHTIGSKANDLVLSRQVIELKNELERVKEQIANVE